MMIEVQRGTQREQSEILLVLNPNFLPLDQIVCTFSIERGMSSLFSFWSFFGVKRAHR